jgi:hypothetical protein
MKRNGIVIASIVALSLVAASCGIASDKIGEKIAEKAIETAAGEGVDIDVSGSGDDLSINVQTEDGSFSSGSNIDLPDGLTIPVPDGGNVQLTGSQDGDAFASIVYPRGRYEDLVSYYQDWTDGTGDEWEVTTSSLQMGEEQQRSSIWSRSEPSTTVIVADCFDVLNAADDGLNAACVTMNQSN